MQIGEDGIVRTGTGQTAIIKGLSLNVRTVTNANYTLTRVDDIVLFSTGGTNRTATLPASATVLNKVYHIKKIDAGAGKIIIDGDGSETIDGDLTPEITARFESFMLVNDGSNWHVI